MEMIIIAFCKQCILRTEDSIWSPPSRVCTISILVSQMLYFTKEYIGTAFLNWYRVITRNCSMTHDIFDGVRVHRGNRKIRIFFINFSFSLTHLCPSSLKRDTVYGTYATIVVPRSKSPPWIPMIW